MFSVAPNIVLAPNMTQNAERKHRTQDANTAHFQSCNISIHHILCMHNTISNNSVPFVFYVLVLNSCECDLDKSKTHGNFLSLKTRLCRKSVRSERYTMLFLEIVTI